MQVTLLYFDQNHRPLGQDLATGQRVLFGQGDRADFPVSGEDIAAVHFAIENDGRLVWVHRLAESMAPVLLNERPVEKSEINDGDTIAAGNTKVRVEIRGRGRERWQPAPPSPPSTTRQPEAPPTSNILPRELPTGLVLYQDPGGGTPLANVIEKLLTRCEPLLIANFRVAGQKPPAWLGLDDDLLAAAPADITDEHSLYLIASTDVPSPEESALSPSAPSQQREMLLALFHELRPHAAAILAFSKASKDDVLKAIGFRRGFYCSADGLEMFLTRGSKDLAKALVDRLHAVLIARAGDAGWALYANPSLAPTPADLGLAPATEDSDT